MSQPTEAWGEGKETVISVEEWEAEPDNDGTCCICLESPTKNPQQVSNPLNVTVKETVS